MADIAPELLKKITNEFEDLIENDEVLLRIQKKIRTRKASYIDAHDGSVRIGEILSQAYQKHISSGILPNGQMYYNIAQRVIDPTLKRDFDEISKLCMDVQRTLNEGAGIGIKPIASKLNQSRIDGIVDRISEQPYEKVQWLTKEPVVNFSQSIVDDHIRENADFHAKAGLSPKIVRKSASKCCEWCSHIAGTYAYPAEAPNGSDVWRRHENCRCTTDYDPGDGLVQDVWSKKWKPAPSDPPITVKTSDPVNFGHLKKLDDVLADEEKQEFFDLVKNDPDYVQNAFKKMDGLKEIRLEPGGGEYKPHFNTLVFDLQKKYPGEINKYSTLAHEYHHYIDNKASFKNLSFAEYDTLAKHAPKMSVVLHKIPSMSDDFLGALRKDRELLMQMIKDGEADDWFKPNAFFEKLNGNNSTYGVQDVIDGFAGTYKHGLSWGHGDNYYSRKYVTIKAFKEHNGIKKAYNEMGFGFKNQREVATECRIYETASEAWANIGSAATCGGPELDAVKEYLPNTYKAYVEIMKKMEV